MRAAGLWVAATVCILAACSASLPPPTGPVRTWKPGEVMKVAVFPINSGGANATGVPELSLQRMSEVIASTPNTVVSHTWYPDFFEGTSLLGDQELLRQSFSGERHSPNVAFIQNKGRALGTDAVLLLQVDAGSGFVNFSVTGWMVAVESGRIIKVQPMNSPDAFQIATRQLVARTRAGD